MLVHLRGRLNVLRGIMQLKELHHVLSVLQGHIIQRQETAVVQHVLKGIIVREVPIRLHVL